MPNSAKLFLSFIAGALAVTAYAWFVMKTEMQLRIDDQQADAAHLTSQLSTATSQLSTTTSQLSTTTSQLSTATSQTDALKAKFDRGTILYERPVNIFGTPMVNRPALKVWVLKADVEPVYIGSGEGLFTHYDPKTQTETIAFRAKK
jgi:hypothetical protein